MTLVPESITAVIFDLDGTLRHSVPNGHTVFWDFAASMGAPNGAENRRRALHWANEYWADSQDLLIDLETFGKENDEFWQNYSRRHLLALGVDEDIVDHLAPKTQEYMSEHYHPEDIIPEDVIPTLDAMRTAGITVGLVTNRSEPVTDYLKKKKLLGHLDFQFAAGEIGTWKPKPEIFYYALGLANAKPHEALYVGDNYFADVIGAQNANILPVLIDPDDLWEGVAECPRIHTIGDLVRLLEIDAISTK